MKSIKKTINISIDLSKLDSASEFYSKIIKKMNFPDYFGNNIDALEECIVDLIEEGVSIKLSLIGINNSKIDYDYIEKLICLFEDLSTNENFSYQTDR